MNRTVNKNRLHVFLNRKLPPGSVSVNEESLKNRIINWEAIE